MAATGAFVQGPRGIPHAFKNEGNAPARMLIHVSPPGFDLFLKEFATPVPSFASAPVPVTPADIERLLVTAPKFGIEILPPSPESFGGAGPPSPEGFGGAGPPSR